MSLAETPYAAPGTGTAPPTVAGSGASVTSDVTGVTGVNQADQLAQRAAAMEAAFADFWTRASTAYE